jgi:hypothetical protein
MLWKKIGLGEAAQWVVAILRGSGILSSPWEETAGRKLSIHVTYFKIIP